MYLVTYYAKADYRTGRQCEYRTLAKAMNWAEVGLCFRSDRFAVIYDLYEPQFPVPVGQAGAMCEVKWAKRRPTYKLSAPWARTYITFCDPTLDEMQMRLAHGAKHEIEKAIYHYAYSRYKNEQSNLYTAMMTCDYMPQRGKWSDSVEMLYDSLVKEFG